jgi:hypothetical protein
MSAIANRQLKTHSLQGYPDLFAGHSVLIDFHRDDRKVESSDFVPLERNVLDCWVPKYSTFVLDRFHWVDCFAVDRWDEFHVSQMYYW